MDADFSIELGREDPVLDFPWRDPAGTLSYFDLKRHPEQLQQVEEAARFVEMADFLKAVNSSRSQVESAKCDAWSTTELSEEEEIYNTSHKCASYADLVFSNIDDRKSLTSHERFARGLVELLKRTPETPSAAEIAVRRCYFGVGEVEEGFYCTVYVSGYGKDEVEARQHWGIALRLLGNAVLQISAGLG